MQVTTFASQKIAGLRGRLGLTQPEFGQLFGVHSMTVSKWERGVLEPSAYQTVLMNEFWTATKKREVDDQVKAIAWVGLFGAVLTVACGFWINRHRE